MYKNHFFFVLAILLSPLFLIGQNNQAIIDGPREDGTIEEQLDYLILKENSYQTYKVIPKVKMQKFKTNVLDTLAAVRNKLQTTNNTLAERNSTISSLNDTVKKLQADLDATNQEKDSVSFLGMNMSKGGYKSLMWMIIAGLAGLLGWFIFRFRESNVSTVQNRKDYEGLQIEFEEHRKRSLEREQKAMRKLQDELNRKGGA